MIKKKYKQINKQNVNNNCGDSLVPPMMMTMVDDDGVFINIVKYFEIIVL